MDSALLKTKGITLSRLGFSNLVEKALIVQTTVFLTLVNGRLRLASLDSSVNSLEACPVIR